jgi:uncharacterized protein (TIGR02145 family)
MRFFNRQGWGRALLLAAAVVVGVILSVGCTDGGNPGNGGGTVPGTTPGTTPAGGAVTIGGKTWMAENLNVETEGSYCYDGNSDSCAKYGRLYTWESALTACPSGWHLPSSAEWDSLTLYVGYGAGKKLRASSGWNAVLGTPVTGTDEYGFSALPGGLRHFDGGFSSAGNFGYWWTATDVSIPGYTSTYALYSALQAVGEDTGVSSGTSLKVVAFSVRCVAD